MQMKRAVDKVTVTGPHGMVKFRGRLFGLTPGCWIVGRRTARKLLDAFGLTTNRLPKCGWETQLTNDLGNWLSQEAWGFRIRLNDHYTYKFTGTFK
jgi:hypothetical protein